MPEKTLLEALAEVPDPRADTKRHPLPAPVEGRVLTGDSLQAQRDVCQTLVPKGGRMPCPSRATSPA